MWRFLNSIPRALRQYIHNPRPSAGIYNVDEEVSDQELGGVSGEKQGVLVPGRPRRKCSGVTGQEKYSGRAYIYVESVFGTRSSKEESCHEESRSHTGSHGGNWWHSCQSDFWRLLHGSNRTLEAISLGSAIAWSGSETNLQRRQKIRLFYRILFALKYAQGASAVRGIRNDLPTVDTVQGQAEPISDSTPPSAHDVSGHKEGLAQSAEPKDALPETLESVLEEYQSLCSEHHAYSESVLGLHAYEQGDVGRALMHLHSACALGNSSACFNLGLCYERGSGVAQDLEKAKMYYSKAAEAGHSSALYNLGLLYLNEPDTGGEHRDTECCVGCKCVALHLLERAATAGLSEAQTYMGVHYMEGQQKEKAVDYFKAAADQNDPEAQYFLAICYEQGLGVEQNECRAGQLYSQSAGAGHDMAMYNLAVFNENGLGGLPEDLATATELYTKAAQLGNGLAQHRLKELKAHKQDNVFQANMSTFQYLYQLYNEDLKTSASPQVHHSLSPSASSPNLSQGDWNWSLSDHTQGGDSHHSVFDPGGGRRKRTSSFSSSQEDKDNIEQEGLIDSQTSMYDTVQSQRAVLSGSMHRSNTSPNLAMVACHG